MKITVAGVGYVGLSLAVLLAQKHEVTAITTTEAKAEKLNKLIMHFMEEIWLQILEMILQEIIREFLLKFVINANLLFGLNLIKDYFYQQFKF